MRKSAAKEKIIQTAKTMIKENGYENTNVIDIAQRADVSVGTLYYHFPKGKNSILTQILSQQTASYVQQFRDRIIQENFIQKSDSLDSSLRWIFNTIIELRREDRQFLAAIQGETLRNPEGYEEHLSEIEDSEGISNGMGTFGQILQALSKRFPDESIQLNGNEKQVLRIIGSLLTHQIIFEGYFGVDDEFTETLTRIFHVIIN